MKSNPPSFTVTVKGEGIKKFESLLKTGAPQEFESEEIVGIKTDWVLLNSVKDFAGKNKLTVGPSPALTNRRASVRVIFHHSDASSVQYNLMEMHPVRRGTEELEFAIESQNVPFVISVVAPASAPKTARIKFKFKDIIGCDCRDVKKAFDALSVLRGGGNIELIDLATDAPFVQASAELENESPEHARHRALISDLVAIEDHFQISLRLPAQIVKNDFGTIRLLKRFMENGTEELGEVSATIVKSDENRDSLPQLLASGRGFFRFEHPRLDPLPKLFGKEIDTGPVAMEMEAEINDLSATIQAFGEARIGGGVKISFRPLAPVKFSLISEAK